MKSIALQMLNSRRQEIGLEQIELLNRWKELARELDGIHYLLDMIDIEIGANFVKSSNDNDRRREEGKRATKAVAGLVDAFSGLGSGRKVKREEKLEFPDHPVVPPNIDLQFENPAHRGEPGIYSKDPLSKDVSEITTTDIQDALHKIEAMQRKINPKD